MNVAGNTRDGAASGTEERPFGFWRRSFAMVVKEFIQLRRDRVSFAMIVMIPVMQLLLFGYAINTTPRNLPTAVLLQEDSDLARSILERKIANIVRTGADTVVTANPGCLMQIQSGLRQAGSNVRVVHLLDLLDEAYRRA